MSTRSVKLRVLGETSAAIDDCALDAEATHVFAALLILALASEHRVTRRRLAALLWPGAPSARQAERLRWLLSKLRGLGVPVEASAANVSLAAGAVTIDYREYLATLAQGGADVDRALDRMDAVLPEYRPDFSLAFERWVEAERETLTDELLTKLVPRLAAARRRGDWAVTERFAHAIIRVAPLHEEATLALGEALCAMGDKIRGTALLDEYLSALGDDAPDLRLPAELLRRRMRVPDAPGTASPGFAATFVGRSASLRRFHAALAEANSGRGSACLVCGPPGIGKTRLLDEMAAYATTVGRGRACVVRARCHAGDATRPLSGVIDLVPKLLEIPGAAGCDPALLQRLERLSAIERPESQAFVDLPTPPADPSAVRDWLRVALLDLLGAIAEEQTTVIQLDDFQWCDESVGWLWDAVLQFSSERRIMWCFAARSESRDEAGRLFSDDARTILNVEWLAALDAKEAQALLDDLLSRGPRTASANIRQSLLARGGGIPLVLQELVRHWYNTGDLASVPSTLAALIDARLARLTPAAQRALQMVGLLGAYSYLDRLERVLQLGRPGFIDAIAQLESDGILTTDSSGATHGHVLWAEAAIAQIVPSVARVLHRHIAEDLEWEMASSPSVPLLWEIARHWGLSGQSGQELAAITSGAEHLVRNGFFAEAAEVYGRALARSLDAGEQRRFLRRRIDLFRFAAMWVPMLADIERHEQLSIALEPLYDRHNELEMLTHTAHYAARDVPMETIVHQALRCASAERASVAHRLQASFHCMRNADGAAAFLDVFERAHEIAMSLTPASVEETRHRTFCDFLYHHCVGDLRRALEIAQGWSRDERARGDPYWIAWSMRTRAQAETSIGEFEQGRRSCLESMAIARDARLDGMVAGGYDLLMDISADHDEPAATHELHEIVSRECSQFRWHMFNTIIIPMRRAQLAIVEGDAATALHQLPPLASLQQFGTLGESTFVAVQLGARMLSRSSSSDERDLHALGDQLASHFVRRLPGLRWAAAVYAKYLDTYRGSRACDAFVRQFTKDIQREQGPPTRRLARFIARATNAEIVPAVVV